MSIKIEDHAREVIDAKDAAVRKFLEEAGLHLEGQAKKELENSPRRIDTGLLRNSITHAIAGEGAAISEYSASYGSNRIKSGKNKGQRRSAKSKNAGDVGKGTYSGETPEEPKGSAAVYVGTNVEYAPYVHYGTRRMKANPFIKNAFDKNKEQLIAKFKQALREA